MSDQAKTSRKIPDSVWVGTTYFAEGMPFFIVRLMSTVYFTDIGLKESVIGYLNWFGLPWNFKFLWAPLVDLMGTRRGWMIKLQLAIALACMLLAGLIGLGPRGQGAAASQPLQRLEWADLAGAVDPITGLTHLTIIAMVLFIFLVLAFLSATHDIAIDAYYIEGLPDRESQAAYTGLRTTTYLIARLLARTVLISFSVWFWGFAIGAAVMGGLFAFHAVFAPRFASDVAKPRAADLQFFANFGRSFASYLQQERVAVILGFILTYKLGDEIMFAMNSTFLMRELAVTRPQLGLLSGVVGWGATIVGTMSGAWAVKRFGLGRAIWPLTLLMNLTIWAYVWLAHARPQATTPGGFTLIAAVFGYEMFAASLGSAVLTVVMIYTCKPEFKAAHFAIGTAIMSVSGIFIGGFAGLFVEHYGYVNLYVLSFLGTIPSMALLFVLPIEKMMRRAEGV